ncbi:MAG: YicC/YloC family endoribonuclease [Pseudomonadota bacterium]
MSAVQSMTGFASVEREAGAVTVLVDARSVNNRGLDVRIRLPQGLDGKEQEVRKAVGERFKRGSITLSISQRRAERETLFTVNTTQLSVYLDAIQDLASSGSVAAPRADGLLALRGVIETQSEAEEEEAPDLLPAIIDALDGLFADRGGEGARIVPIISAQLAEIERLRKEIDAHPERAPSAVKARLVGQMEDLLGQPGLSPERLHQEAALLATRADVREELDRLDAHVAAARDLLSKGGPVGRKLDFLAQEFNRETNTICSKAPHHEITALGLELKAVVEQFREQVQNLE